MSQRTDRVLVGLAAALGVILAVNAALSLSIALPQAPPEPEPPEPVEALVLFAECPECLDVSMLVDGLEASGVVFANKTIIMPDTDTYEQLIAEHDLERLPALLVSESIGEHLGDDVVAQLFEEPVGGYRVLTGLPPPYVNVSSGKTRGIVEVTLLDAACEECYNVSAHLTALQQLGLSLGENRTVMLDSEEGARLTELYGITAVPTVIVGAEAGLYPQFGPVWGGVGTRETDGAFVFRNASLFGTYYDVAAERLVEVKR